MINRIPTQLESPCLNCNQMSKSGGWTQQKRKRFRDFVLKHKNYLDEFFNEKLSNPEVNRPIKSGFFNQMAEYIDYDKHCCRSFFKRNLGQIFGKMFGRSAEDCVKFFSYLEKKKKSIKKKRPSNVSKQVQKIRRRFNKHFREKSGSGKNEAPAEVHFQTRQFFFGEPFEENSAQMKSNMGPANPSRICPIGSRTGSIMPSPPRNSAPNMEHIFVEHSGQTEQSHAWNMLKCAQSDAISTPRFVFQEPCSLAELSQQQALSDQSPLFASSPKLTKSVILGSGGSDGQLGTRMCGRNESGEGGRVWPEVGLEWPKPPSSLEPESRLFSKKSIQSLCPPSLKINEQKKVQRKRNSPGKKEDCVCEECTCEEDYLMRQMMFKTHSSRMKITPEIFDSIQKVRLCLDCFQPVLKSVDKNQFIVQSSAKARPELAQKRDHPDSEEDCVFLSEESDRVVSDSNSQDFFKFKLMENAEKTGSIDCGAKNNFNLKTVKTKKKCQKQRKREENERREKWVGESEKNGTEKVDRGGINGIANNLRTVKPGKAKMSSSNASENELTGELGLGASSNQIERIKDDIDKFQSVGDFGKADSNWIGGDWVEGLETTSLIDGLGQFEEEPEPLRNESETEMLKNLIQRVRKDTFSK